MIGKTARELTAEEAAGKNLITKVQISLDCNAPFPMCSEIGPAKNFIFTLGQYWVKYKPSGSRFSQSYPFLIWCDLFIERGCFTRVKDWNVFLERAATEPRYKFLLNFTGVCKELFDLAEANQFTPVCFTLDILKYDKAVKDKYKKENGTELPWGTLADPLLIEAEWERYRYIKSTKYVKEKIKKENTV